MESVKSAILSSIQDRHGPCVLQLDTGDLCIKIVVNKFPDHIIYVRPNDRQTQFLCHYAHRDDVARRLCGVCICKVERFVEEKKKGDAMMEYFNEEQVLKPKKKSQRAKSPECVCGLDTDMHAWRQQARFQMVRVFRAKFNEFAKVAVRFVDDVVGRLAMVQDVPEYGRKRFLSFEQQKVENERYPRPKKVTRAE